VKLRDITKHFQSRWKDASVAHKTQKAVNRYRNSGEVKYPRIYGYRQTPGGVEVVQDEAKVVRIVLGFLVMGKTPEEIKKDLDRRGVRNRSGNRFTEDEISKFAKPVYSGMVAAKNGRLVQSRYYEPIVSVEILKKAQKALKRVSEGADYCPPAIGERVFLTLAEGRRHPDTKWDFLGLP
jgi:hypothetical protein